MKEAPGRVRELAPPVEAAAAVETAQGVLPVELAPGSKGLVAGANAAAGRVVDGCLMSTMKVAKAAMGSVAMLFTVFAGLRRILGNL